MIYNSRGGSSRHNVLFEVLKDCFDSLPAVNSDTSLPIYFKGVTSFPNTRYSFYPYEPSHDRYKIYSDVYQNTIERSCAPYGYEFEDCFSKHPPEGYKTGKNTRDFTREFPKHIDSTTHVIHIKYVLRSNTFIVKSSFDDLHRYVFFKQSNKLIATTEDVVKWRSYAPLPSLFRDRVLDHIKNTDGKLHQALTGVNPNVMNFRTVLNNPFWKETQALFLLDRSNRVLRKRVQSHFRRKSDYFVKKETFGTTLPDDFKLRLRSLYQFKHELVPLTEDIYNYILKSKKPELATFEYVNPEDFIWRTSFRLSHVMEPGFDEFFNQDAHLYPSFKEALDTFKVIKREYELSIRYGFKLKPSDFASYGDLHNEVRHFVFDFQSQEALSGLTREVVKLRDGSEVIFNPTTRELSSRIPPHNNLYIDPSIQPDLCVHKNVIYKSTKDFVDSLPLCMIFENADVLSTKSGRIKELLKDTEISSYSKRSEDEPRLVALDDLPF